MFSDQNWSTGFTFIFVIKLFLTAAVYGVISSMASSLNYQNFISEVAYVVLAYGTELKEKYTVVIS